ncbi:MAG: sulfotransferase [Burkholderiales bacterium]
MVENARRESARSPWQAVYISSSGHSGSTLLDMMLGNASYAQSLGEVSLLRYELQKNAPCTCGAPVGRCELWSRILSRYAERTGRSRETINLGWMPAHSSQSRVERTVYAARRKLSHGVRFGELRAGLESPILAGQVYRDGLQRTAELYEDVARITGKRLLVNSSKNYLLAVDQYLTITSRVKIVNLVRDGRAVYASFLRHGFNPERSVKAWQCHYERAGPLFRRFVHPDAILDVRYEDLATDPERTLRKITDFLAVPFEEQMLSFGQRVHHNINGNDIRFKRQHHIKLDERWRRELTPTALEFFIRRAGQTNEVLGYGCE